MKKIKIISKRWARVKGTKYIIIWFYSSWRQKYGLCQFWKDNDAEIRALDFIQSWFPLASIFQQFLWIPWCSRSSTYGCICWSVGTHCGDCWPRQLWMNDWSTPPFTLGAHLTNLRCTLICWLSFGGNGTDGSKKNPFT